MADWESAPVAIDDNTRKFLDFLGKAEGADYNTIVGGKSFDSYAAHPDVVGLRTKDGPSTAAGRYQITKTTYDDVAPKLGINDFSPQSQDLIALELIKRNGALKDVQSGDYQKAISKLGGTWASLPSSPYAQPKRSQGWVEKTVLSMMPSANATDMANVQAKAAPKADDGWESATPAALKNDAGWESAAPQATTQSAPQPVPQPAPVATPQPTPAAVTPAKTPEQPLDYKTLGKKALRVVDDAVRGAADTLTFGFADEIAAKMNQLTGRANNYEDALKAERARDAEGGAARLTGQVAGALVPSAAVVRGMDSGSRLVRMGAGAGTGAIQGGLYGAGSAEEGQRLEGAQQGAAFGALTGGVLGGVLPATVQQKGSAFIDKAGSKEAARLDAEIIQDLAKISENPTMRGGKVQAVQANALESKYVNDVQNAIKGLGKEELQKLGVSGQDLNAAVQGRKILTADELQGLRSNPVGLALADSIEKAQRTRSLTAANPADNNFLVKGARVAADWTLPGFLSKPINYMLNNRKSREEVIQGALKNQEAAGNVLERLGPSQATQSLENLQQLAQQAQAARQAQTVANQNARAAAKAAPKVENPNLAISELQGKDPTYLLGLSNQFGAPRNATEMSEFSKVIQDQMMRRQALQEAQKASAQAGKAVDPIATRNQVLQTSRVPLGGGYQELLQGGRSGLNMTTDQATDALRIVSKLDKNSPISQAAKDLLQSRPVKDENAFYGVQNTIRRLSEEGKLPGAAQPGALSELSSGIRNPVSYAANVKNAEEALKVARDAAPTKDLTQFANSVGRIKNSADKLKAVEERLAKATDPAEVEFLNNFVRPLTNFGKGDKPVRIELRGMAN